MQLPIDMTRTTPMNPPMARFNGHRSRRRTGLPALLFFALLAVVAGRPAHAELPPTPAGWNVQFADDFLGPVGSLPSGDRWRFALGHSYPGGPENWGNGEVQAYTKDPANVSLDGNGVLLITPRKDAQGRWTSARIETNVDTFKPKPGEMMRVEARIRMPDVSGLAALGYWPAFWMVGGPYRELRNWPGVGEFDIMEGVNGLSRVWGALHCGFLPGGPCKEPAGIASDVACPNTTCQAAFHVYAFEWDLSMKPAQLRWYVDGTLFHHIDEANLPAATWREISDHRGYFILLNVAMGSGFPDAFSPIKTPVTTTEPDKPMMIDYVGVWIRPAGVPPQVQTR
jgi:beta-glucanase (GH16 family)